MHYKTIILELIQENLAYYEELRSSKRLLTAIETYATELRQSHRDWQATLAHRHPGSDPTQIASAALELAVREWQERFASRSPSGANHPSTIAAPTATSTPATPLA